MVARLAAVCTLEMLRRKLTQQWQGGMAAVATAGQAKLGCQFVSLRKLPIYYAIQAQGAERIGEQRHALAGSHFAEQDMVVQRLAHKGGCKTMAFIHLLAMIEERGLARPFKPVHRFADDVG